VRPEAKTVDLDHRGHFCRSCGACRIAIVDAKERHSFRNAGETSFHFSRCPVNRDRRFPPKLSYHALKGQTIAGVARDHFGGHVHLQALSSRLNSTINPVLPVGFLDCFVASAPRNDAYSIREPSRHCPVVAIGKANGAD
jgi:hypothetical protein